MLFLLVRIVFAHPATFLVCHIADKDEQHCEQGNQIPSEFAHDCFASTNLLAPAHIEKRDEKEDNRRRDKNQIKHHALLAN